MSSSTLPDTVVGPRKRRPSERVTQNGDPLSRKKVKTSSMESQKSHNRISTKKVALKGANVNRRASVEDVTEPPPPARLQPQNPNWILEASDGSDNNNDDDFIGMPQLEVAEDDDDSDSEDEDDEDDEEPELVNDVSELGECFLKAC
jgi:hypothetical protein